MKKFAPWLKVEPDDASIVIDNIVDDHEPTEGDRHEHPRSRFTTDYSCSKCGEPWPCDTAYALSILQRVKDIAERDATESWANSSSRGLTNLA